MRLKDGRWLAVVGLFDPLTATQANRISRLRNEHNSKILAVVLESAGTLLDAGARAALVAALRAVDLVAISAAEQWRAAIPQNADVKIVEDPAAEQARSAEFVRFVLARQHASASK